MKELLLIAAFWAGAFAQTDSDEVLDDVKWRPLPPIEEALYPPRTVGEEFSGRLTLECRILDAEGNVDCDVPDINPVYIYVAEYAVSVVERHSQVDMERTPGAAIGKRLRVAFVFPAD